MTVEAKLLPTAYAQPRPVDGIYPATVYREYAIFEYDGFKVRAQTNQAFLNANGNQGTVTVKGNNTYIEWEIDNEI